MKTCIYCNIEKPFTEFHQKRGKPQARCKACRSEYMKQLYIDNREREMAKRKTWYENNKLHVSEKGKAKRQADPNYGFSRRLKKYGITKDQYFQTLQEQNNACALCKSPFTETPAIDHCHDTLIFRGLLCDSCNTGFGLLKESIATFQECIAYATKYKKLG